MQLYDTLSRMTKQVETGDRPIKIYQCGPTVYDTAHIGHARPAIVYDTLVRYLRHRGHRVTHVVNFTDVDDKIINRAHEKNQSPLDLAQHFIEEYLETIKLLGVEPADYYPRVSDHIDDIIEVVGGLVNKGYAYESGGDVYFDVSRFEDYGKLSNRRIEELVAGARVEVGEHKKSPADFALWKAAKPGEIWWESPWGRGRPGWHIECSVLILRYLGETIDIHGGGTDLIFPHHENEIAQAEAYTGKKPFVRIWMHCGLLQLSGEKMSKSEGNVVGARDAIKKYGAETIRYFMLSSHYRKPLSWDEGRLENARSGWERFRNTVRNIKVRLQKRPGGGSGQRALQGDDDVEQGRELGEHLSSTSDEFDEAMEADFNTSRAIAVLYELAGAANRYLESHAGRELDDRAAGLLEDTLSVLTELGGILGIYGVTGRNTDDALFTELVELLLSVRAEARSEHLWQFADQIRDHLKEIGITVEDTASGPRWFWQ